MGFILFCAAFARCPEVAHDCLRKNTRFRKQIFSQVGFRQYKGNSSMRRISLGSFLLFAAVGLAVGCASTTTARFNIFNRNKPTSENCVDVGAGPICEGPVMGGGEHMPADSGFMLPGDSTVLPGPMSPGAISTPPGTIFPGNGAPPANTFMPPAGQTLPAQPQRLKPITNGQ